MYFRGIINEYRSRLGLDADLKVVTLGEGNTPLVYSEALSSLTASSVWLKFDGANPTGSFKDRGMTVAVSKAVNSGVRTVICASTGNTSASAAAYSAAAGIECVVLIPEGFVSHGKLCQAVAHGARVLQIRGNFDSCLRVARELAEIHPVHLVNSINPDRISGQKTAAFEIIDALGDAPDYHYLPVGNAGNYTAYYLGYSEEKVRGNSTHIPRIFGFQASGAAPIVSGHIVENPQSIATAIRIGNPASWKQALHAQHACNGYFGSIDDSGILEAQKLLARTCGLFVEPASAISVAGLLASKPPEGSSVVCTLTGHGLKDQQLAFRKSDGTEYSLPSLPGDSQSIASYLNLA
ncbi:MAG: threonine synthase [Tropheryma whipplei]|uniref:Threonine synthase n=1 Tax=Tropheryma whipplei (strain Twist) TaxID=203267 RepID=Q83G80_TROWT|nr:threonine synthase [Tropheryma whipplei]AAO44535.1 threonine synthase [Tropheryma whipplei str. Twist]MCO8182807.1 threonine synthase [Tropheryma whipplei]CAD67002.1 threonine synthase [Tropheryma whipplei TW08/27]